jgi:hypothetical protein
MPYEAKKERGGYTVRKKAGGKKLGTHKSKAKAQRQIAAIHANEKKK